MVAPYPGRLRALATIMPRSSLYERLTRHFLLCAVQWTTLWTAAAPPRMPPHERHPASLCHQARRPPPQGHGRRQGAGGVDQTGWPAARSEEHTSELQSLMRISSAVFWLKKKKNN